MRLSGGDGNYRVVCRVLLAFSHSNAATVAGWGVLYGLRSQWRERTRSARCRSWSAWAINQDVMSSLVRATCLCVRCVGSAHEPASRALAGADVKRAAGFPGTPCEQACCGAAKGSASAACGRRSERLGQAWRLLLLSADALRFAGRQEVQWHAGVESSSCLGFCLGGAGWQWWCLVHSGGRRTGGRGETAGALQFRRRAMNERKRKGSSLAPSQNSGAWQQSLACDGCPRGLTNCWQRAALRSPTLEPGIGPHAL